jgi:hypothetical protein
MLLLPSNSPPVDAGLPDGLRACNATMTGRLSLSYRQLMVRDGYAAKDAKGPPPDDSGGGPFACGVQPMRVA